MRAKAAPALVRYGSTLNLPRILSLNTNDEGREKMNLEKYKKDFKALYSCDLEEVEGLVAQYGFEYIKNATELLVTRLNSTAK